MQGPIRLSLERLAKTYGIEDLGSAWITTNLDGSRSLVLQQATPRAPLGSSEHRAGLALDFVAPSELMEHYR